MPKAAPAPASSVLDIGAGTGSITFDADLDQTVPLDPSDWRVIDSSQLYSVGAAVYQDARTVAFSGIGGPVFSFGAEGWRYTPGVEPIRGLFGLEVAAFGGFE